MKPSGWPKTAQMLVQPVAGVEHILGLNLMHAPALKDAIGFRQPPEWRTTRNTLFIRMMKLPERRLRYHHPAVKAVELACDRRLIE